MFIHRLLAASEIKPTELYSKITSDAESLIFLWDTDLDSRTYCCDMMIVYLRMT